MTNYNTLPKRKSEEKLGGADDGGKVVGGGRSLPNEKQPRSGSWNAQMRKANAVLPSKYSATPPAERSRRVAPRVQFLLFSKLRSRTCYCCI